MGKKAQKILIFGIIWALVVSTTMAQKTDSLTESISPDSLSVKFINDSIGSTQDSLEERLIRFSHQYEYIPEYEEEIIKERLAKIENEIPLTYNPIVNSFINYFTITDREYTKKGG